MVRMAKAVALPSGVTLPYVEQGDPSGTPVLFLHGITDSWRSFEPVLPYLPPSLRAFAVTQRGHGDAGRPATGYAPQDFAADLAAFMDAVGLERAVVVGHSMGATVAQRFALDYPQRTLGLALAGSFVDYRNNPVITGYWDAVVSTLTDPISPAVAREFQESTLARRIPPERLELFVAESLKVPARVWKAGFRGLLNHQIAGELGRITVPTLLLWGDQDAFVPRADQETLLASIRRSRLVVYVRAGHALHWEQPARFAGDLDRFITSVAVKAQEDAITIFAEADAA